MAKSVRKGYLQKYDKEEGQRSRSMHNSRGSILSGSSRHSTHPLTKSASHDSICDNSSDIYITSAAYRATSDISHASPHSLAPSSRLGHQAPSHYSCGSARSGNSTVKTHTSRKDGIIVETMSTPNPFCPNTKGICCLMLLLNLGLILVTLGFVIVIQFFQPLIVWILGIVFLVFGFLTLIGSLVYCVHVFRNAKHPHDINPEDLYWTRYWQGHVGSAPEVYYKAEDKAFPTSEINIVQLHYNEVHAVIIQTPHWKSHFTSMVKDPLEVLQPKKLLKDKTQNDVLDKTKVVPTLEKKMYSYKDHNVLQGGISQAQLLTHTVQVGTELPKQIKDGIVDLPENVENLVKGIMYNSYIYDAHQELLPKRKDPNRPMWVFPRDYGLTTLRKSQNVSRKFLQLCESLCGLNIASDRGIIYNGHASIIIERSGDPIFLDLGMDLIVTSTKPLSPFLNPNESIGMDLPDIRPLHYTIGLEKRPMNSMQDTCAIEQNALTGNVHTIIIYHIPESTKNITLLPVTQDQILACSLMKSFTAAACYARQKFGADVQELPQPVTVQCIQSNSQDFHFSVFQLNTLDLESTNNIKNFWWSETPIRLFTKAQYEHGRPTIEGINFDILKMLLAFYKNM
ncbi:hypothetical protein KM043_017046 [Ampulex compressa]|nr:hypothetical protein KM043_017046 [Ampulex compressa]